ncbi:hypothetical protein AV530_002215 [Patagioenas fasciata monilis]|uniref:Uncharacterized protein n=1 Tax=Patagioenas fasciata monilis TaxID=372326 RepID=A0A1V4K5S8_PATFA|nr:hypothetical protein AV530_002215 [Patagioenas fasciata monilis]
MHSKLLFWERESRAKFVGTTYNTLMGMQPSPLPAIPSHSLCLTALSQEPPLHPSWGLHQGKRSARDGKPPPPPAMASLHLSILVFIRQQEALKRPKEKHLH